MSIIVGLLAVAPPPTGHSGGSSKPWALILVGVAFVLIGSLNALKPDLSWRASRWQFKNPDAMAPSDAALVVGRVVGVLFAVIGVVLIIVGATK